MLVKLAPPAILAGIAAPELIHQLRVATRRCEACVRVFARLITDATSKRWTGHLKSIRQQAGPVRDLDVFIQRLESLELSVTGLPDVLEELRRRRSDSYRALATWLADSLDPIIFSQMESPGNRLRYRDQGAVSVWGLAAYELLQPVMDEYLDIGNKLMKVKRGARTVEALHRFRIRGKRVRYAVEICASGLRSDAADKLTKRLTKIQNHLGQMNDHSAAATILGHGIELAKTKKLRDAFREMMEQEQAATTFEVEEFHKWYSSGQHKRLIKIWSNCRPQGAQKSIIRKKK